MSVGTNIIKLTNILRNNTVLVQYDDGNTLFTKGPWERPFFVMNESLVTIKNNNDNKDNNESIHFPAILMDAMQFLEYSIYMEDGVKKVIITYPQEEE